MVDLVAENLKILLSEAQASANLEPETLLILTDCLKKCESIERGVYIELEDSKPDLSKINNLVHCI